ncbi:putative secreted protein (Por secretion system target) [Pontibacter ummariensis]|uniref:Por secretion system C-terminal sorting domain-containing protein n=1 Tax=Pontibacter ummariensis TaxID=1610492 RepID=A0A239GEJ9_9BACT|nr:LamG-like jellyroll fold domain-containing protein [Pontibacter ummariensis]PRY11231.1 putative secreted protein (Por secretion system target) [Pontibacter ummariensis]SNS67627.1 Por secretion system C-terminal sorting domain-containing protein [Pontibacter ummariensis]
MRKEYPPCFGAPFTQNLISLFGLLQFYKLQVLAFLFVGLLFMKPAVAFGVSECPPGLQHYFGFDEPQDGGYVDLVSGNKATCTSCPSTAASLFAGGQQFKENKVNFHDISNFNWGVNGSFTISFWMKTTAKPSQNMVIVGRSAEESQMMWWAGVDTEGYAVFELYDKERNGFLMRHEGKKLNDGKWHHIAVARDDNMKFNKLYVDGYEVEGFEYFYKTGFESNALLNIGYLSRDKGYYYTGLLDELMVHSRALEYTEVLEQYNNGAGNYCGPKQIAPRIVSEAKTFGVQGQGYTYAIKATGNPAPGFKLVSGPAGMSVSATDGTVEWVPASAGKYKVVLSAENSIGKDEQQFEVEVKKGLDEPNGIQHHWMLNETSGVKYKDFYTPYEALSAENTKPAPVFGVVGTGQYFDGKDDAVEVSKSVNFDWEANANFSIELWVKTTASTAGNRVFIGRDAEDSYMHWWVGADEKGQAGFQLLNTDFDGTYVGNSGPKLNDGKWHQVVAVRNSKQQLNSLYVDGALVAEKSHVYRKGFSTLAAVTFGYMKITDGYHYEGTLDEVKLFGRALSASEIQERYSKVYGAITELIKFEGHYAINTVNLDWETAAEYNNDYFTVERGANGKDYTEIGNVKAAGTTSFKTDYKFVDEQPLNGLNYYRLKIVKKDGLFTYSPTVVIEKTGPTASAFYVYPNPTSGGEVNIKVTNLTKDGSVQFILTDLSGRKLLQNIVVADAVGAIQLVLPVPEKLKSGLYLLSVVTNTKTLSRKLVVVR